MRFVRSMLIGAFALAAVGAEAQQPTTPPAGTRPRAGADSQVVRRRTQVGRQARMPRARAQMRGRGQMVRGRAPMRPGWPQMARRGAPPVAPLFAGIRLTQDERTAIRAAREKHHTQVRSLQQQMAPDLRAAADARRRRDTTAAREAWTRTADERARLDAALATLRTDIRNALTPDHRVRFDENLQRVERRAILTGLGSGQRPVGRRARR